MNHDVWFASDPAEIIDLAKDHAIPELINRYCGEWGGEESWRRRRVFQRVLTHVYEIGARTAVIERRYTDVDFRDEHSKFYAQTFRSYPSTAHRLHFFRGDPPHEVYSPDVAASFDSLEYLGYSVLRPVAAAPIGRTMLAPSADVRPDVTCLARDRVNFFGTYYEVEAAPFIAQDNQLGVCAHAATWVVAYYHHLRYGGPRYLPGNITDAMDHALTVGRRLPTPGMRVEQLSDVLESVGLPPIVYWLGRGEAPRETDKIARRYLDSGIPLLVGTDSHTFALVGYNARRGGPATFIAQDDEEGPYRRYNRPLLNWADGAWRYLIAPAPDQLYITAEGAEPLGRARIEQSVTGTIKEAHGAFATECGELLAKLRVTVRSPVYGYVTSAVRSNEFKHSLSNRGYDQRAARGYMRLPMSKWIWVVEVVDVTAFHRREPSVVAEAIIDSTEHIRDGHVLAWRVPGSLHHWNSDQETVGRLSLSPRLPKAMSICSTSQARSLEPR